MNIFRNIRFPLGGQEIVGDPVADCNPTEVGLSDLQKVSILKVLQKKV